MGGRPEKKSSGCLSDLVGTVIVIALLGFLGPVGYLMVFGFLPVVGAIGFNLGGLRGALAALAAFGCAFIGETPSKWLSLTIFLVLILTRIEAYLAAAPTPSRKIVSSALKGLKETSTGVAMALAALTAVNLIVSKLDHEKVDLRGFEAGVLYLQTA